jgi:transitional endoplasmic reticulum ATPase
MLTEIILQVQDPDPTHVGRNIVTLDKQTKISLGITSGDIVEIEGSKKTAAIVWPARTEDDGKQVIRMDSFIRHNAGVALGERVKIRKGQPKEAKRVTLAPIEEVRIIASGYERILKKGFLGRPLTIGDNVWVSVFGSGFIYRVVDTQPRAIVKVTDATVFALKEKPVADALEGIPRVAYEDIGGLSEQVKKVREMVELPMKHPELFQKLGVTPPKGILMHGPPGTGKTLLAKAVANEAQVHFISISAPEVMGKFVGEAEERVRKIFKEAEENAPSIVFIDEIDAIAAKRDEVVGEVERRVVAQLLSLMDGLSTRGEVVVMAATNRVNSIDEALRRPGRFDREIEFGIPDKKARKKIMGIHMRGMPIRGELKVKFLEDEFKKLFLIREKGLKETIKEIETEVQTKKFEINKINDFLKKKEPGTRESLSQKIARLKGEYKQKNEKLKYLSARQDVLKNEKQQFVILENELYSNKKKIREIINILAQYESFAKLFGDDFNIESNLEKNKDAILTNLKNLKLVSQELWDKAELASVPDLLEYLANRTQGFSGADLQALTKESAMKALRRYLPEIETLKADDSIPIEILELLSINKYDFIEGLKDVQPSGLREFIVEYPTVRWGHIGSLDLIKEELKQVVEWPLKNSTAFVEMGIRPPKGVLLFGPPGTGKTLLAKAIATESEANFISVKGPELLTKWVGDSAKGIRKLFRKARQMAPSIIFIDEIDSVAYSRHISDGSGKVNSELVNQILTELDGMESLDNVIFIAATNRPDLIDKALLRPGRIDKLIRVPAPDEKAREKILGVHTKKVSIDKKVSLKELARRTQGFSGADIEGLIREAALLVLKENKMKVAPIEMKHFEVSLRKVKPTIDSQSEKAYEEFKENALDFRPSYVG